jgi:hypothetical protein
VAVIFVGRPVVLGVGDGLHLAVGGVVVLTSSASSAVPSAVFTRVTWPARS